MARGRGRAGARAKRTAARPAGTLTLIRRVEIAQGAVDRFQHRPLVWGREDCWRLMAYALAEAGWPEPVKGLTYASPESAHKALRKRGHADLAEAMDVHSGLARIPLAFHLPGDIVLIPSDDATGALGVAVGSGRALAFVDGDHGEGPICLAGAISTALICWRLEQCPR